MHIDGFNLLPYLMGEAEHSPRRGFFYFNDDAELVGMRFENWKIVFAEQRCQGTLRTWAEPFTRAAGAQAVQPAHRPVRVRRHHVEHVLRVVPAARLLRLLRDGDGVDVPRHVQGVPAAAPTGQLQHRSDRQEARTSSWRPTRCSSPGTTDRRSRRSSTSWVASPPKGRITLRRKPASRCSTTTARCGARSRCTSSSTSCSAGSRSRPRPTRRCATSSRTRRRTPVT